MDFLSKKLQPYKTFIGSLASVVTVLQFFSGIPICLSIRKKGSTNGFSVVPFLGGAIFSILGLQYGFIINDDAMINVNILGFTINILYIGIFYIYSNKIMRSKTTQKIVFGIIFSVGIYLYSKYEHSHLIEFRFGMIMTVFLLTLIGSPLLGLGEIIRNKSTEGLPFPIIASGTLVSFLWLLYGIVLNNELIVIQNCIALLLSSVQLFMFIIYPSKNVLPKPKKAKKIN